MRKPTFILILIILISGMGGAALSMMKVETWSNYMNSWDVEWNKRLRRDRQPKNKPMTVCSTENGLASVPGSASGNVTRD
jgi:hypothetical protein